MIEHVDQRLVEWVTAHLGDVIVDLEPPNAVDVSEAKVHLYLMDLYPAPPPPGGSRPPKRWILRYLVTAAAPAASQSHRLLGQLAIAAMESNDFEVESEPLPSELWRAFGIPPRPALMLQAPMIHEVPRPRAPSVRQPLVLTTETMGLVQGVVLGPGDLPMVGARVGIPDLGKFVSTDHDGRFSLAGVPAKMRRLRVECKGKAFDVEAQAGGEPLVIRYQFLED